MKKLTVSVIVIAVLIGGCVQYDAIPEDRELFIEVVTVAENDTGGYNLSVTFDVGYSTNGHKFENVSVRGFDSQGETVCSTSLGTVNYTQNPGPDLNCSGFPKFVVLYADSSPCDDNVKIQYAVYREFEDGNNRYITKTRSCGDKVPPTG